VIAFFVVSVCLVLLVAGNREISWVQFPQGAAVNCGDWVSLEWTYAKLSAFKEGDELEISLRVDSFDLTSLTDNALIGVLHSFKFTSASPLSAVSVQIPFNATAFSTSSLSFGGKKVTIMIHKKADTSVNSSPKYCALVCVGSDPVLEVRCDADCAPGAKECSCRKNVPAAKPLSAAPVIPVFVACNDGLLCQGSIRSTCEVDDATLGCLNCPCRTGLLNTFNSCNDDLRCDASKKCTAPPPTPAPPPTAPPKPSSNETLVCGGKTLGPFEEFFKSLTILNCIENATSAMACAALDKIDPSAKLTGDEKASACKCSDAALACYGSSDCVVPMSVSAVFRNVCTTHDLGCSFCNAASSLTTMSIVLFVLALVVGVHQV
jgi:hypothetical protein